MPRAKHSTIINRATLREGGATGPTIEIYQRASGRCRVWWYAFDQEGGAGGTIAAFSEKNWQNAVERGGRLAREYVS